MQSAATTSALFSGFPDAQRRRHRLFSLFLFHPPSHTLPPSLSLSSLAPCRMQQKRRVSRDCIARCEPRNCSCGTAKLGGIRTNGIQPGSLIRPSRATYNYSVSMVKPVRFPYERAHTHTQALSLSLPKTQTVSHRDRNALPARDRRVSEIW